MVLLGVLLAGVSDNAVENEKKENAEKDQNALTCRLILLYLIHRCTIKLIKNLFQVPGNASIRLKEKIMLINIMIGHYHLQEIWVIQCALLLRTFDIVFGILVLINFSLVHLFFHLKFEI